MTAEKAVKKRRGQAIFVRWMGPLLDVLRQLGGSASPREASDGIALKLGIVEALLTGFGHRIRSSSAMPSFKAMPSDASRGDADPPS